MLIQPLYVLIIVIVLVSLKGINDLAFMHRYAFIPYEVKHHRKHYRFITHLFVHADAPHLIFNMLSLYMLGDVLLSGARFGPMPNDIVVGLTGTYGFVTGTIHFMLIFFLGGIFATFWPMHRNQDNPAYLSVGASGGVSAIVFAMILWSPKLELGIIFLPFSLPAYIFGPIYLAFEFFAFRYGKTNIAHDAHIGGAIFGILYILVINFDKVTALIDIIKD